MSAFATLTLSTDGTTGTEVLKPQGKDSAGVAKWLGSNSVYDAKRSVTLQVNTPKPGGNVARIKARIVFPVMDLTNPNVRVGESYANVEFVISKVSPAADRSALRYCLESLANNAVLVAAVNDFESVFA